MKIQFVIIILVGLKYLLWTSIVCRTKIGHHKTNGPFRHGGNTGNFGDYRYSNILVLKTIGIPYFSAVLISAASSMMTEN